MTNVREPEAYPQGPGTEKTTHEQVARFRARQALVEIEVAQRALARAAELLYPAVGAEREHGRLCKLRETTGRVWHSVVRLFDRRLDLVCTPTAAELRGAQLVRVAERFERSAAHLAAVAGGAR